MKTRRKINILKNEGYYLPLFNLNGMVSSITPFFSGDLKKGYYNYALKPVSETDLFNLTDKRNVLFFVNNKRYDLNGQMEWQQRDKITYEISQLKQIIERTNDLFVLTTKSFVAVDDNLEVHEIIIKNISKEILNINTVTSFPFYSRSPENIFDHRHVTSLLNKVEIKENTIINKPTLSFDERGHKENNVIYTFSAISNRTKPNNYVPVLDDYINGGSYLHPKGLNDNKYGVGDIVSGYEVMGTINFKEFSLKPNEEATFLLTMGIFDSLKEMEKSINKFNNFEIIKEEELKVDNFYKEINNYINFNYHSEERIDQLKWVTLQPILRRHLGNSYLPHHDYGHGGRGWRDLWQDLLALIYSADKSVEDSIFENFKGVRIDGSNATIIGNNQGEFIADRNKIVRVWSDHGAWPLLTVKMYIDETGNTDILLKQQTYFEDQFTHYTKRSIDYEGSNTLTFNDNVYYGTVLEHLILQNIVGYFNTGKKGFTRLEDADWNDGLDMANKEGETVAFTMFYLNNLRVIVDILNNIESNEVQLYESLMNLINEEINLDKYFDLVSVKKGLNKVNVDKETLISKLSELIKIKENFINKTAIINNTHYQSYVNNDGNYVDSFDKASLIPQAMALVNNIPSKEFAGKIATFIRTKLFDQKVGGYRLNSNYNEVLLNMGRAYGFAYGHKENGAVFSHMATMYNYGLYNYDLVFEGREGINTLLDKALDPSSQTLAGVPEYFTDRGVGKYFYLTGTASWLIKLIREQIFGIRLSYGKLEFKPKLTKEDFIDGVASVETYLFNKKITIKYINDKNLDYNEYKVSKIIINNEETKNRVFTNIDSSLVEVILDENN